MPPPREHLKHLTDARTRQQRPQAILEASAAELKHNPTIAVCSGQSSPGAVKVVQPELEPSAAISRIGARLDLLIMAFQKSLCLLVMRRFSSTRR